MRSILNFLKYYIFGDGYIEPGIQIFRLKIYRDVGNDNFAIKSVKLTNVTSLISRYRYLHSKAAFHAKCYNQDWANSLGEDYIKEIHILSRVVSKMILMAIISLTIFYEHSG